MRIIRYYVVNKLTRKELYTNCDPNKCQEYINQLPNANDYAVGYKWLSL